MKKTYCITIDFDTEEYGERDMDIIIYDFTKLIRNFYGIWDTKINKAT